MREAAETLQRHDFVRIHRRFLVNRAKIRSMHLNGKRAVVLESGAELPVGRAYEVNLGVAR
jgi:DNA-binding LytR/AlgR family response regulator